MQNLQIVHLVTQFSDSPVSLKALNLKQNTDFVYEFYLVVNTGSAFYEESAELKFVFRDDQLLTPAHGCLIENHHRCNITVTYLTGKAKSFPC